MNAINQIIIEGTAKSYKTFEPTKAFIITRLDMESERTYRRNDGSTATELTPLTIEGYGLSMAMKVRKGMEGNGEGAVCRVVGRLSQKNIDGKRQLAVVAEFIEFPHAKRMTSHARAVSF